MSDLGRILILGATGQVGKELQRSFAGAGEIIPCDRERVDLADQSQLLNLVRETAPDLILNAAAYTAVDRAESEPESAMAVNAHAPRVLAEEARRRDILLVHFSTDYVFDGSKTEPWIETDRPNPLNVYGVSKLAGEEAIREVGGKYLIFRTSWVYGQHGKNFLLTMLNLGRERDHLTIVDDQFGAPTTSVALADATRTIVEPALAGSYGSPNEWSGLYHMTCGGLTTWCGFARAIFTRAGALISTPQPAIEPVPSSSYRTAATRPTNSVLSNQKLFRQFRVELPGWEHALDVTLGAIAAAYTSPPQ